MVNEDGVPISDARITVVATGFTGLEIEPEAFRAFRDPNHHYVARSDAKGEYSIPSIGYSGNARINVWAKGYANVNSQFMVEPGGAPITLDITLPKKGLLLKARILDGLGNPVPDAFVVAPSWNSNSGMSRSVTRFFGQTDETGHVQLGFAMLGGSSGTSGIAHLLVSSPFAGVASFNGVPIGKESVVDLRMEPPATMRGRIEPSEDLGLFPRKVVLSEVIELDGSRDFGYTSTYIAPVSIDGEFVLDTIPPNRAFTLWVQDNYNGDIIAREKLKPFSPGEVRSLNRSAGTGVVVQGTVYGAETGQPIPNVRVGHGYDAWQIVDGERAWTDENGKYTLVVSSEIESVNMFSAHAFIRETELQRLASEFGERFEIRRSLYEGVDLRIPDPIELTIQVLDISKHPIRHAAVIVNGTQLDYTNSSGICTLALNSAYVDSIRVRKHGYIHSRIEDSLYELQAPTTMNLHVLLRTAAGGLEGWFRRSDGTPIVNATVHAEGLHDSGTAYSVDSETNAEGKFILLDWCPEGSYERIELSLEHQDAHGRKILENVELESGEVLVLDPIDGE
ncbi:MAG: hypothetical protein DHS20C16_36340 [Phycisphaerae bacterium]|nr:MAG: hypothetical protein DHS20C16_36340 [Phycisphaerae bacterium]